MSTTKNTSMLFLITIGLSVVAKLSGMIREVIVGYYYGAGAELDLFYYIYSIPELFMTGITSAAAVAIIPFLYSRNDERFQQNSVIVSQVLVTGTLVFAAVTAAALIFNQPILNFYLKKLEGPASDAFSILLISCLQIVPTFICAVLLAVETKLEKFKTITLLSLPLNVASVAILVMLNKSFGVLSVGIGLLAGVVFQLLYLVWDIRREGLRWDYRPARSDYKKSRYMEFMLLLLPVYFGTVVQRAGVFVDRYLAAGLKEGSISALSYADRIIQMVVMIVVSSIGMVLFAKISSTIHDNEEETVALINSTFVFSFLAILPVSAYLAIYSKEITAVLFGRGRFGAEGLQMTATALCGYSIGLIGIGLRYVLNRVFFAQQNMKTPTWNTVQTIVINVVLSIILCRAFGLAGIAWASSISMILSALMLAYRLEKSHRFISRLNGKDCLRTIALTGILALVWAGMDKLLFPGISSNLVRLAAAGSVGILIFLAGGKLLKIQEFEVILAAVVNKIKPGKRAAAAHPHP